jgi:hypothetical protein
MWGNDMNDSPDQLDEEPARPSGRRWTRLGALSAATAVAGAGVLVFAFNTTNANADPNNNNKYFVCKYVGTPGVDERLQTGQNPISVSGNAIAETPVVVGSFFKDAQGRSFVLALDNTPPGPAGDPGPDACPAVTNTTTPPPSSSTSQVSISASGSTQAPPVVVTQTVAVAPTAEAPVPGAVAAGRHTSVSNTSIALGGALMALGVAGLLGAVRPWKRGSH